jgi:CheY-like chemotaxis protein
MERAPPFAPFVVLVEDEPLLAHAWRRLLAGLPIRLQCFAAAEPALAAVRAETPALVLSDHQMPGMTGLELLERIVEEDLAPEVVLVTSDTGAIERASHQGIRALDKTSPPGQLRALVETLVAAQLPPALH